MSHRSSRHEAAHLPGAARRRRGPGAVGRRPGRDRGRRPRRRDRRHPLCRAAHGLARPLSNRRGCTFPPPSDEKLHPPAAASTERDAAVDPLACGVWRTQRADSGLRSRCTRSEYGCTASECGANIPRSRRTRSRPEYSAGFSIAPATALAVSSTDSNDAARSHAAGGCAADLDSGDQRWALIGGFAVSARSEPRFTRDIVSSADAVEILPAVRLPIRQLCQPATTAARWSTTRSTGMSSRWPVRRSLTSTVPSARPLPTTAMVGTPISSASLNFTPGETFSRSS